MSYIARENGVTTIITTPPYREYALMVTVQPDGKTEHGSYTDLSVEQLLLAQPNSGDFKEVELLRDVVPQEFFSEFMDTRAAKMLYVPVTDAYGFGEKSKKVWVGTHKNVFNWWELDNGYAVGWNENPSVGWAFPVKKMV